MDESIPAVIFDIQHFSIHDGPGIRTTVFFKGCPLRCRWCHNPEGLTPARELSFNASKCTGCGACAAVCPKGAHRIEKTGKSLRHSLDRAVCSVCGQCAEACLYHALECSGRTETIGGILKNVMKDQIFYETSGGGLTLSGGEPLAQPEAAVGLLTLAKRAGLHTCVETSGYASEETLTRAAAVCDLFLVDYKETDAEKHLAYTGVTPEKPRRALRLLDSLGAPIILRCPIIPALNDRPDHAAGIAAAADAYPRIAEVHIEPYHPLGLSKSQNFGKACAYDNPAFMEKSAAQAFADLVSASTSKPVRVM